MITPDLLEIPLYASEIWQVETPSSKDFKLDGDKTYVHYQRVQSDVWEIQHDLDKYPSVFIVDSANSAVVGDIHYVDANKVIVTFSAAFSGKAFCN